MKDIEVVKVLVVRVFSVCEVEHQVVYFLGGEQVELGQIDQAVEEDKGVLGEGYTVQRDVYKDLESIDCTPKELKRGVPIE